jgi:hypothetical protein
MANIVIGEFRGMDIDIDADDSNESAASDGDTELYGTTKLQNTADVTSSILLAIVSPVYYLMHRIKTYSCPNSKTIFIF